MEEEIFRLTEWIPIFGKWVFRDGAATYLGAQQGQSPAFGLALGKGRMRRGKLSCNVIFDSDPKQNSGRLVFGYSPSTRGYYSAGIHGYGFAHVLAEFTETVGWKALAASGSEENTQPNANFDIAVQIRGQRVHLTVNDIQVIAHNLPRPLDADQVGLFTWGPGPVKFENVALTTRKPEAFVVMQFGEPYDSLYTEVIKPVVSEHELTAYRVDEVYRPGIILQDITTGIVEAEIVIAEITPPNPNVFYELGYAHAMEKPTILLVERGKELPFDIKSYRCIFYDNTIKGKRDVESDLRRHLTNILRGP